MRMNQLERKADGFTLNAISGCKVLYSLFIRGCWGLNKK